MYLKEPSCVDTEYHLVNNNAFCLAGRRNVYMEFVIHFCLSLSLYKKATSRKYTLKFKFGLTEVYKFQLFKLS